ncbi:isopenicillin N synthase family dioxygenase [Pseudoprimorskyibacter insulae]|uniref:2-oxoglutarate-dependent ethylene/succinate-forming enzyme n=1 Tax=Pseudoprimorskyibacter insulae TaxID=1695997 RepID=A0A2R8AX51_9RHOB|nr:2-oxoglutarate and iron-dependent oxygenase domain-containing protein [Pseudoprimorskyibacter insulae]SPF80469.1 2-oxoglutarate-dependent ethylene/succinate-forming enzyme [Pseudoprimorskyibacter insulae]
MIPRLDAAAIAAGDAATLDILRDACENIGFLTVYNTPLTAARVRFVLAAYRAFFDLPESDKRGVDMARTGANRGWGGPMSEQVDPDANPDYKQVFDCGFTLPAGHRLADLPVYAPNQWPALAGFREVLEDYYRDAMGVAMGLLRGIAQAIGEDAHYFDDKFDTPMALLRGNYYPQRPDWAGEKDFGIAAHTDYGCLTLLATDGVPGLEVLGRDDAWMPVNAQPGEFVINFGEMLEMWTEKRVIATLHRVKGSAEERISVPLFFNPNFDANVAPMGAGQSIVAGDHLSKRFAETYLHLKKDP